MEFQHDLRVQKILHDKWYQYLKAVIKIILVTSAMYALNCSLFLRECCIQVRGKCSKIYSILLQNIFSI